MNEPAAAPVVLIVMGVSGSGKSTAGRWLASQLSAPFIEGDEFHPPANVDKMRAGIPLEDADRWPWLDRLAQEFTRAAADHARVVGACSALKKIYRTRLRERIEARVLFVYLEASEVALRSRMGLRTGHFMPPALLASQLATLEPPDRSEFALSFDSTRPRQALLRQIEATLQS